MTTHRFIQKKGVAALRNRPGIPLDLAERFDVPPDAVPGSEKISVYAGKRALIEEYADIQEYGEDRIIIRLRRGKLILTGRGLYLEGITQHELVIGGELQNMEWT